MPKISNRVLGLFMLVAGGIVGEIGWQEKQSIGSSLKSAVTGSPSDKAVYMFVAAVILVLGGLYLVARSNRK